MKKFLAALIAMSIVVGMTSYALEPAPSDITDFTKWENFSATGDTGTWTSSTEEVPGANQFMINQTNPNPSTHLATRVWGAGAEDYTDYVFETDFRYLGGSATSKNTNRGAGIIARASSNTNYYLFAYRDPSSIPAGASATTQPGEFVIMKTTGTTGGAMNPTGNTTSLGAQAYEWGDPTIEKWVRFKITFSGDTITFLVTSVEGAVLANITATDNASQYGGVGLASILCAASIRNPSIVPNEVDKSVLTSTIGDAKTVVNTLGGSVGDNAGDRRNDLLSNLNSAITAAEAILEDEHSKQLAVNEQVQLLKRAMLNFEHTIVIDTTYPVAIGFPEGDIVASGTRWGKSENLNKALTYTANETGVLTTSTGGNFTPNTTHSFSVVYITDFDTKEYPNYYIEATISDMNIAATGDTQISQAAVGIATNVDSGSVHKREAFFRKLNPEGDTFDYGYQVQLNNSAENTKPWDPVMKLPGVTTGPVTLGVLSKGEDWVFFINGVAEMVGKHDPAGPGNLVGLVSRSVIGEFSDFKLYSLTQYPKPPEIPELDKTALESMLATAQSTHASLSSDLSTDSLPTLEAGKRSQSLHDALGSAIVSANEVSISENATQAEVDAAVAALERAEFRFRNTIGFGDLYTVPTPLFPEGVSVTASPTQVDSPWLQLDANTNYANYIGNSDGSLTLSSTTANNNFNSVLLRNDFDVTKYPDYYMEVHLSDITYRGGAGNNANAAIGLATQANMAGVHMREAFWRRGSVSSDTCEYGFQTQLSSADNTSWNPSVNLPTGSPDEVTIGVLSKGGDWVYYVNGVAEMKGTHNPAVNGTSVGIVTRSTGAKISGFKLYSIGKEYTSVEFKDDLKDAIEMAQATIDALSGSAKEVPESVGDRDKTLLQTLQAELSKAKALRDNSMEENDENQLLIDAAIAELKQAEVRFRYTTVIDKSHPVTDTPFPNGVITELPKTTWSKLDANSNLLTYTGTGGKLVTTSTSTGQNLNGLLYRDDFDTAEYSKYYVEVKISNITYVGASGDTDKSNAAIGIALRADGSTAHTREAIWRKANPIAETVDYGFHSSSGSSANTSPWSPLVSLPYSASDPVTLGVYSTETDWVLFVNGVAELSGKHDVGQTGKWVGLLSRSVTATFEDFKIYSMTSYTPPASLDDFEVSFAIDANNVLKADITANISASNTIVTLALFNADGEEITGAKTQNFDIVHGSTPYSISIDTTALDWSSAQLFIWNAANIAPLSKPFLWTKP